MLRGQGCKGYVGYDIELRERVIKAIEKQGMTITEAAKVFQVSRKTIHSWKNLLLESKNLKPKKRSKPGPKVSFDDKALILYVEQNPSSTQQQMADHFKCSNQLISCKLKKLNITRKKNNFYTLKEITQKKKALLRN